jgi:5-carboxymethyl-2-hydroxymuconate isomerase
MATWADLTSYVRSRYKISEERPNLIKLVFETGNLRSQAVLLWHLTLSDGAEEWVQIESSFGELGSVNLAQALQEIGNTVCGGMAVMGDLVTFRHAVPLLNLNINEFERPLALVTSTADHLEHILTAGS